MSVSLRSLVARWFAFNASVLVLIVPSTSEAFDRSQFLSVLQDYQRVCSLAISSPLEFHDDPGTAIGITGDEDFFATEDLSHTDFSIETRVDAFSGVRVYGIVSTKVGGFVEQSCQVIHVAPTTVELVTQLANIIREEFGTSPNFEVVGGKWPDGDPLEYSLAITGLYEGVDIISLINLNVNEISIEHIHISKVD